MSMFFSIVVFIALHVIPADVNVFEIADPAGKTVKGEPVEKGIRFTKNEAGGWDAVDRKQDDLGHFTLDGTTLRVAPPEDEQKRGNTKTTAMPMDSVLKLQKEMDWNSIARIELMHEGRAAITRGTNEVTVAIIMGSGEALKQQTFIIRWKEKAPE